MSALENASYVSNSLEDAVTFRKLVLEQVAKIPSGRVMTYGEVALFVGRPGSARQVGGVLFGLGGREAEAVPWHRVVNAQGRLSTYKVGSGELQRALLEAEGVMFSASGRLDLKRYRFSGGGSGET